VDNSPCQTPSSPPPHPHRLIGTPSCHCTICITCWMLAHVTQLLLPSNRCRGLVGRYARHGACIMICTVGALNAQCQTLHMARLGPTTTNTTWCNTIISNSIRHAKPCSCMHDASHMPGMPLCVTRACGSRSHTTGRRARARGHQCSTCSLG
jgi:hypothetical protein